MSNEVAPQSSSPARAKKTKARRQAEIPPHEPPLLVDIKGAARLLSVGPWAVRSLLWARKLKFVQIGQKFLIDPKDITAFIEQNKRAA